MAAPASPFLSDGADRAATLLKVLSRAEVRRVRDERDVLERRDELLPREDARDGGPPPPRLLLRMG